MSAILEQGFSATVELELHLAGEILPLAQVGPDQCILVNAHSIQAGRGEIIVTIDGHVQKTQVDVHQPSSPDLDIVPLNIVDTTISATLPEN